MTPDPLHARYLIADPDTGTLITPEFAIVIDLGALSPDQVDRAADASELDMIPDEVVAESMSFAGLIADALRWRAYMATPYSNSDRTRGEHYSFADSVRCPACDVVGNAPRWIDPRTAVVVPWESQLFPRPYALVCHECEDEVTE